MIKNLMRAATAAALAVLPLASPAPAHAHAPAPAVETLLLPAAVEALPVAVEVREGYQRTSFKHWNAGKNPSDGCNTRMEVLLHEAAESPEVLPGCKLSGGLWWSYYDNKWLTSASALDVDHLVPLAEAWDSGASQWTAGRREAYANDLDEDRSLVAVSAASNRSKADKDPAEWLPPSLDVRCRYASEWIATKLRWGLTADTTEREALRQLAPGCPGYSVSYAPAP
ncbi:HNH endonuclease family protein [Streptomyces sp. NPDC000410]|uniref:HNH endonuclease family protein n=1 Tax=Streptomyces sp. NPDC000410 TaxID=3154254 RepID=UPI00333196E0